MAEEGECSCARLLSRIHGRSVAGFGRHDDRPSSCRPAAAGSRRRRRCGRCRRLSSITTTTCRLTIRRPAIAAGTQPLWQPQRTYESEALPPPGPYGAAPGYPQGREPVYTAAARPVRRGARLSAGPAGLRSAARLSGAARTGRPSAIRCGAAAAGRRLPSADEHRSRWSACRAIPPTSRRACRWTTVRRPARARSCRRSSGARTVEYRTREPAGTIIVDTAEHVSLSRARQRQGDALRHRRRPRRLHLGRRRARHPDGRVAGLASAAGDDRAPALPAALHGRRRRQSARRARALSRQDDLPHPRHQSAVDHRHVRVVGLHPPHQRGRHDLYYSREGRHPRRGACRASRRRPRRRRRRRARRCRKASAPKITTSRSRCSRRR